jgi:hypothetical protein
MRLAGYRWVKEASHLLYTCTGPQTAREGVSIGQWTVPTGWAPWFAVLYQKSVGDEP